jgi:holo-[acyl-carrier protein] synthase
VAPRFSVGIDLTSVEEVADSITRFGERFLERVFTEGELRECVAEPRRLACRLAAKEAVMKALGAGAQQALPWRSIGVFSSSRGGPSIRLTGRAQELARRRGISNLQVSMTRDGALAVAVAIAHRAPSN